MLHFFIFILLELFVTVLYSFLISFYCTTCFYVKHFESALCMKRAIEIKLPCLALQLHSKQFHKQPPRGRFNVSLLKDPEFDKFLKIEWASFMDINESPNNSPTLLWETAKTVIWGEIISYLSYKKKTKTAHKINLELKI